MSANPADTFFWNDWENEAGLKLCSLSAQGLWMRMLCICARSEPRGYLMVAGSKVDAEALATIVGRPISEVETLLAELEKWRVFSRNRDGIIYNRRMVERAKTSADNSRNGKKGGRASRDKKKGIFQSPDTATDATPDDAPEPSLSNGSDTGPDRDAEPLASPLSPLVPKSPFPSVTNVTAQSRVKPNGKHETSTAPPNGRELFDPVKDLFDTGVRLLGQSGISDARARSAIGKWRKTVPDEKLIGFIVSAAKATEPLAYVEGCIRKFHNPHGQPGL